MLLLAFSSLKCDFEICVFSKFLIGSTSNYLGKYLASGHHRYNMHILVLAKILLNSKHVTP